MISNTQVNVMKQLCILKACFHLQLCVQKGKEKYQRREGGVCFNVLKATIQYKQDQLV